MCLDINLNVYSRALLSTSLAHAVVVDPQDKVLLALYYCSLSLVQILICPIFYFLSNICVSFFHVHGQGKPLFLFSFFLKHLRAILHVHWLGKPVRKQIALLIHDMKCLGANNYEKDKLCSHGLVINSLISIYLS